MSQDSMLASGRPGRDPDGPANASEVVVSVRDVTKYFGPLKVLDEVSLEVRQGQLVAIVGDRPQLASAGAPLYESMQWLCEALRAIG